MAHTEQREYLTRLSTRFPEKFTGVSVLEVGSLNINGTVRDFFAGCTYIGVDLADGPGVDMIGEGQLLDFPDRHFDTVISAECFEHNPYWLATFLNMHRMSRDLVTFTCAGEGRAEHGTARSSPSCSPLTIAQGWDYYRNLTVADFTDVLNMDALFREWDFEVNVSACDLYFYGLVR